MSPSRLVLPASLLLGLGAAAQGGRDANHPLPAAAATITSSAPQLQAFREPAPPVATVQALRDAAAQSVRRSQRRPEGLVPPGQTDVQFARFEATQTLWALGADWKARFDSTGFDYVPRFAPDAPRNFPLRFELDRVTVGGEPILLQPGEPKQIGRSVRTDRGGLTEVVDAGLDLVEQSFVFDVLPNRGAVAVAIRVQSELVGATTAGGVCFRNDHGQVTYEKAVAVDAAGRQLALPITWREGEIRMEIPAEFVATAQLPLVLDPWLNSIGTIGSGTLAFELQRDPDVASIQSVDAICVVWKRQWSATDQDCFAQIFDSTFTATSSLLYIDYSSLDWLDISIAGSNYAQNFLVVAQVRDMTLHYIGGVGISANGTVGQPFDIERNGVVGLPGNNFHPDVGGDFYNGTSAYYAVAFEKEVAPGNTDIYVKLVTQSGTLLQSNPSVVDNSTQPERFPSISKCNGSFGATAGPSQWLVTYQRTYFLSPFDEDVFGKFVVWNGQVASPWMLIANTGADEARPASSSPADVEGQRYWMCVYEMGPIGARDLVCKVYDSTGAWWGTLNLDAAEAGGTLQSRDRSAAHVDSDGARFVVGYMEPWNGVADWETLATTIAFSPTMAAMRLEDERVGLGLSVADEVGARVCSRHSGGGQPSPDYVIVDANWGSNTIELYSYGGYTPGAQFGFYPTQCGTLAITPTGSTALGGTVTITAGNGGFSGTVFGFPGYLPLNALGCNCVLGVGNGLIMGNPLVWSVPVNPAFVGTVLSVQGWTLLGSNCLGWMDLSDTVDFTIR